MKPNKKKDNEEQLKLLKKGKIKYLEETLKYQIKHGGDKETTDEIQARINKLKNTIQ